MPEQVRSQTEFGNERKATSYYAPITLYQPRYFGPGLILVTVLLERFATQMLAPSKAMPTGSPPVG